MADLVSLEAMEPQKGRRALADALSSLLASHELDGANDLSTSVSSVSEAVIAEVRAKLNLTGDNSPESTNKITKYILDLMTKSVLSGRDSDEILKNVGQAGRIPAHRYKVVFTESFTREFRPLGIIKKTIIEAIHSPDDFQHLMSGEDFLDDDTEFSLFIKRMPDRKNLKAHWLIVQTLRRGMEQVPQSAWWVHPSHVDISKSERPLDVLEAFSNIFGADLSSDLPLVSAVRGKKFAHDITFPTDELGKANLNLGMPASLLTPQKFFTVSIKISRDKKSFRIALAYSIVITDYKNALKNLGAI